jgi:hypothetical protein
MPTLRVLNSSGDRHVTWEAEDVVHGDPEALAAVREAERIFARERERGAVAFRVRHDAPAERLDVFDPLVEETVVIPPMVGG